MSKGRVLMVDDDRSMCEMLSDGLMRQDFAVTWNTSAEAALQLVLKEEFDTVLADLQMPEMDGTDLCRRILTNYPTLPVVVMTAFGSLDSAVSAIRAGAYDFVTKPVDVDTLALTLERAVNHRVLLEKVRRLTEQVEQSLSFGELVGASKAITKVYDMMRRVADVDSSVLLVGESGTGKELVARALHRNSLRRDGPFVALNCSAMPEPLLESELFGHVTGAFTGARGNREGLFVQAQGGTLLLDEIGEMPQALQPKILRAIEERSVRPVGGNSETAFDARIIAATNADLEEQVGAGTFREDLFYRLNVIQIDLPPLRARGNDILLLAQKFVEQYAVSTGKKVTGLSTPFAEKLLQYPWPGNVRELRNCIERAVALTEHDKLVISDLPEKIRGHTPTRVMVESEDPHDLIPMEEVERRYIFHVLRAVGGNKAEAARVLGFDRKTLYRKLESYKEDPRTEALDD